MMQCVFMCVLFILLPKSYSSDSSVSINIKQGKISGILDKSFLKNVDFFSFKGIPYAQPPIGDLKFKAPVQHQGWDGEYKAFKNKPTCLQFSLRRRNGEEFGLSGSEDCLYLNVFTPNLKGSAPVIVFDYNDNFRTGFNGTETYAPDFFMEEDVVVVTISHRLGILGYLTTEDEVIPGNNGLRDFILGLQWIQENIEQFGGDPNRVTLMGNRGGAIIVNVLLYSIKAKNLFNAAILQSGTSFEPSLFYKKPREAAFELGKLFGINTTDSILLLEGLQKIDSENVIRREGDVMHVEIFEATQLSVSPFGPIVERGNIDPILTVLPEDGRVINDVPIIIGMNSREGLDLVSHFIFEPRLLTDLGQDFFVHLPIRTGFRFNRNSTLFKSAVQEIQNFYLEEGYLYYNNILEYAVYVGDILHNYALNLAAEKLSAEINSALFYYVFDFRGYLNENSEYLARNARFPMEHWGATITDELCYLHLCSRIKKHYTELLKLPAQQPEFKVLKKMIRMWTNFAKHWNPTPSVDDHILKDFIWKPLDKQRNNVNYLHITKKLVMKENPMGNRTKFWDDFIKKYSTLAIDGVVNDTGHDEL
ncbi:esterase E4-like [Battus philenor]|uniref:esterase E4-like n=1 Tax=Battus philenor TaxID=42288 RepID=UPI0035CEE559